ncbi:MAG: hypothetical protein R3A10_00520 [Caldilineaceae bacterium]
MKVLLLEDVPSLGLAGEVYAVAGGYTRNYLIAAMLPWPPRVRSSKPEIKQANIRRHRQRACQRQAQAQVISSKKLLFHNAGDN